MVIPHTHDDLRACSSSGSAAYSCSGLRYTLILSDPTSSIFIVRYPNALICTTESLSVSCPLMSVIAVRLWLDTKAYGIGKRVYASFTNTSKAKLANGRSAAIKRRHDFLMFIVAIFSCLRIVPCY